MYIPPFVSSVLLAFFVSFFISLVFFLYRPLYPLQKAFKDKLDLRVNMADESGAQGNTNCGDTAKTAFANIDILVEILQIYPRKLVYMLKIMIECLTCGDPIDSQKFREYCDVWLDLFHGDSNINWNWMSQSVHFLMHHVDKVIDLFPCAPGLMSEEGSECNVKYFRKTRTQNARQIPSKNLEDCFKRQEHKSDAIIQSLSSQPVKRCKTALSPDVLALLAPPESYDPLDEPESESESDSEVSESDIPDLSDMECE